MLDILQALTKLDIKYDMYLPVINIMKINLDKDIHPYKYSRII